MSEHSNFVDEEAASVSQPLQAPSPPSSDGGVARWSVFALRAVTATIGIALVSAGICVAASGRKSAAQPLLTPANSVLNSAIGLYENQYSGYSQGQPRQYSRQQYHDPTASYQSYSDGHGGQVYADNQVVVVHHHNVYHTHQYEDRDADVRRFIVGETAFIKGDYGGYWPVDILSYTGDRTYTVRYQNNHRDGRTAVVRQENLKHTNPYFFSPKVWSGIAAIVLLILTLMLCASCTNQKQ